MKLDHLHGVIFFPAILRYACSADRGWIAISWNTKLYWYQGGWI